MRTGLALRVLVVDDTRTVRELLAFTIDNDDRFSVVGCAADGEQAIRLVEEHPVDAIILDLQMERMDGLTALPRLRQLCPDAVIAAHSLDCDALQRAVVLGADLSVVKGTGLDELMDAIAATRERHAGSDPRQKTSAA